MISVTLVACGGGGGSDASPPDVIDGGVPDAFIPPGPDAAMATCTPMSGTNVVGRMIENLGDAPLLVTAPPGDVRLFVIERTGAIQIIENETVRATPFIDLDDNAGGPVLGGGEQGLLGLAFHPQYAQNGLFYVSYTTSNANVVAEYRRSASDPNVADPAPVRTIISIPDFASNHNGGMIEFGSDGYLYLATGDGGGGGDPNENGQNLDRLLGKMLRIDVDNPSGGREYGIPAGNPYAAGGGAPEVFMNGLRNPWRWSFDRATGDIYIGDVGQESVEEVSYVAAAQAAGKDFGWDDCEGLRDYEGSGCTTPAQPNRVAPVYQQVRPAGGGTSNWASVIGGQVYRGSCYPDLVGRYFFSDHFNRNLFSFVIVGGVATDIQMHPGFTASQPTSIHADALGELYITYINGNIVKLEVQ
jgi:glucose/arabinose dehydrogenase